MKDRRSILLAAAVLLSGCAALPGGGPEPLDTFELTTPSVVASGPNRPNTQILVAEPTALKQLDSQDIVIRTSATSIEHLGGAQWVDRLPRIVQAKLVEALQSTERLGGVGKPGEGLAIDYQIVTAIRSFEIRVDGGERAVVELFVKILNDRNGVVRRSRAFRTSVPTAGSGNDAFIAALDQAFEQAAEQVVGWILISL